ncbi:Tyrosine recombinase XerA [uncultured archaeon]|nr:Tyrosine recombinase XerA [uncultured archaeon]
MVHKYNIEKRKKKISQNQKILKINRKHIMDFIENQGASGNKKARQVKYLSILGQIGAWINYNFEVATKKDIEKLCSKINGSQMADWTKHDYLLTIKVFYRFIRDTDEYPPEVKWIRVKKPKRNHKLPRDLITMEEVKELVNHANNLRDRCFVLLLYESGARISEIIDLKIRDVEFDKYGARVTLPDYEKTGARKIRIIASAPAISNWMFGHPRKDDRNAPLFCGIGTKNHGQPLDYRTPYDILKELGKKAGIDKPMNPHHFRHSRATELAKHLTEAQLCAYLGWAPGSREASTYVHLSGRDMYKAILALHGYRDEEEEKKEKFSPIECPRCHTKNDAGARFCSQCSLLLDEKSIGDFEKDKDNATALGFNVQTIMNNKELMVKIMNMMAEEWEKQQDSKQ